MLPIVLAAVLAASPAERVAEHIARVASAGTSQRVRARAPRYARQLVDAARREARRRGLDWLALLAIARVETGWQWWRRRPQDGAHGPWQLSAHHSGPMDAVVMLAGCGRTWGLCEATEVAARRTSTGRWSPRELRDPYIAAYITAIEVQRHVVWCYRRHPRGHRAPRGCPRWLARWGHYQSGIGRPSWYYVSRLCRAWRELRGLVTGGSRRGRDLSLTQKRSNSATLQNSAK